MHILGIMKQAVYPGDRVYEIVELRAGASSESRINPTKSA
jgi:hypothetical protein